MSSTALQTFLQTQSGITTTHDTTTRATQDTHNELMGAFFSVNPITAPYETTTTTTTASSSTLGTTSIRAAPPKVMPDREIYVARYGKIYKRKAPSPLSAIKKNSPPGFQYCKICDMHKPLVAFYTATKRYVCRKCHKLRVSRRQRERFHASIAERISGEAWMRLCFDRIWFGYFKVQFDSTTIKDIVTSADIPWELFPCACPIDPSLPMRPRNVAILSRTAYSLLLQIWKHSCSRGVYIAFVQRCNLVPPRFDVAFPLCPYADESYLRPIIDVAPILLEEQTNVALAVQTADHTSIEHLQNRDVDAFESMIHSQQQYARTAMPREDE